MRSPHRLRFCPLCLLGLLTVSAWLAAAEAPRPWDGPGFEPLTPARIEALAPDVRPAWQAYWAESQRRRALDEAQVAAELAAAGLTRANRPKSGHSDALPLNREAAWYASEEARELVRNVISFQTPAGGWNKSFDVRTRRQPGDEFGVESAYRGTFDNEATIPQLRFLALAAHAGQAEARAAFDRGLDYVFAAQYPNGGFPQIYPLRGGYHDNVTFNDNAIIHILELLRDLAAGTGPFATIGTERRAEAAQRLERAVACVLTAQVRVDGRPVAWGQQHDAITLAPAAARNFEPIALCTSESAGIVAFLMSLPAPSPDVVAAVEATATWLTRNRISDRAWINPDGQGDRLVERPGARPLWARLYEIGTDRPVFGDRDKTIHLTVDTISPERRNGYAWYVTDPGKVLTGLPAWRARTGRQP